MSKKFKVAFQGEKGAYSHLACLEIFPNADVKACKTFDEAFMMAKESSEYKIVIPITNSSTGSIADMHYLLPKYKLQIHAEHFQKVSHNLLGIKNSKIQDIKAVRSHAQAHSQCSKIILENNFKALVSADTAGSAKLISEWNNINDAAIASELAAKIYNLDIIDTNFQDTNYNVTRFLVMSKDTVIFEKDTPNLITTLVFKVRSIPAALYKSLGGFASNGVNLTKLESYVHPQGFNVAQFYIDFEGHPEAIPEKLALEEMRFFCKEINILGVYKASDFRKK